jgi:Phosphatidylinositol 3- and 4-kinase
MLQVKLLALTVVCIFQIALKNAVHEYPMGRLRISASAVLIICYAVFYSDRTPFVLTSDMAYVINGGDKPSERFQYFVDLCCQAFNIIRRNSNLFMNLFSLVS